MNLFKKRKYVSLNINIQKDVNEDVYNEPIIPDGLWIKCTYCGKTIYKKELGEYLICPNCSGCFRLGANDRIAMVADEGTFFEHNSSLSSKNPMGYPGYEKKIEKLKLVTGLNDAVVSGVCEIGGHPAVICAMDSNFIMGSMGSVVGEKVTRAFEYGVKENLPVIIFTASGGARMQEGIISLMQMAKVSAAINRHSKAGLLYITVLTDPTTGGVTASFGMLGDIIIAEPKAMVGFAGRRVIEQTIKQTLPEGFQTSESLLEHGFIDAIIKRCDMKKTLSAILHMHASNCGGGING